MKFMAGAMDARADRGLSEENTQGEGDSEMMGLEDIAAEAREVEFDWLRSSDDPQLQDTAALQQLPDEFLLLHNFTRCTTSEKLAQYGKGLFCDSSWGSRQFVTQLNQGGRGSAPGDT